MNGILNENQVTIVEEYEIIIPLIHKIDSPIDNCFREHNKYFQTFEYNCVYDVKLTNISNIEIANLAIADKSKNLYELNKKLTVARQKCFIFDQTLKLTKKLLKSVKHK